MKAMGVDVGEKRIGVAVSDDSGRMALPSRTLSGDRPEREVVADLVRLAHDHGVQVVVVGMPIGLSGEAGPAADQMAQFVDALRAQCPIEVATWDERLTTTAAEKTMLEADVSREQRRASIDKIAAALILQSYLDAQADDEPD
jgi:putative Holliday junction resolvase